jgi:hypothetical protein
MDQQGRLRLRRRLVRRVLRHRLRRECELRPADPVRRHGRSTRPGREHRTIQHAHRSQRVLVLHCGISRTERRPASPSSAASCRTGPDPQWAPVTPQRPGTQRLCHQRGPGSRRHGSSRSRADRHRCQLRARGNAPPPGGAQRRQLGGQNPGGQMPPKGQQDYSSSGLAARDGPPSAQPLHSSTSKPQGDYQK